MATHPSILAMRAHAQYNSKMMWHQNICSLELEGVQYAMGEDQKTITNSFRKSEVARPKWKWCSNMDVSGGESKVWYWKIYILHKNLDIRPMHACQDVSVVSNSSTQWTVAHQTSLSMGFSKQEYLSGLPFPPPGVPSNPEIRPMFHMSLPLASKSFTSSTTWEDWSESVSHSVMASSLQLHGL